MPKVMNINIAIELSSDEWEEAEQKVALKPARDQFVAALNAAGIQFKIDTVTDGVWAQIAPIGVKRRGRKPKLQAVPTLPAPPDGDEAA